MRGGNVYTLPIELDYLILPCYRTKRFIVPLRKELSLKEEPMLLSSELALQLKSVRKPIVFSLFGPEGADDEREQIIFKNALVVEVINALRLCGFCQIYAAKLLIGTSNEARVRRETFELLELFQRQIMLLRIGGETLKFETLEFGEPGSVSIRLDVLLI
ncbi:MAG: hypothetical protein LiPW30_307 [Parcubacteria group bacterium LiPW_30]|nr:MAG: hypothetical protein LiPW30_307 [Parcubacteria group bacterium LiPW_30]